MIKTEKPNKSGGRPFRMPAAIYILRYSMSLNEIKICQGVKSQFCHIKSFTIVFKFFGLEISDEICVLGDLSLGHVDINV